MPRLPGIVNTEDNLVKNAHHCATAVEDSDLEAAGKCFNLYWEQKKKMAPGCEPSAVAEMRQKLEPYALGMSMAGAGGGGFLYILLKPDYSVDVIADILKEVDEARDTSIHTAEVDTDGLVVRYEDN